MNSLLRSWDFLSTPGRICLCLFLLLRGLPESTVRFRVRRVNIGTDPPITKFAHDIGVVHKPRIRQVLAESLMHGLEDLDV